MKKCGNWKINSWANCPTLSSISIGEFYQDKLSNAVTSNCTGSLGNERSCFCHNYSCFQVAKYVCYINSQQNSKGLSKCSLQCALLVLECYTILCSFLCAQNWQGWFSDLPPAVRCAVTQHSFACLLSFYTSSQYTLSFRLPASITIYMQRKLEFWTWLLYYSLASKHIQQPELNNCLKIWYTGKCKQKKKNMVNSSYLVRIGITKISAHGCNSGINVMEITNYFLIKYEVCSTGGKNHIPGTEYMVKNYYYSTEWAQY